LSTLHKAPEKGVYRKQLLYRFQESLQVELLHQRCLGVFIVMVIGGGVGFRDDNLHNRQGVPLLPIPRTTVNLFDL
jgi:hypothetical protein